MTDKHNGNTKALEDKMGPTIITSTNTTSQWIFKIYFALTSSSWDPSRKLLGNSDKSWRQTERARESQREKVRMAAPGIPSPGSTPGTATGIPATPGFQHPFVTPSPYYNHSIASTGWTSKPAVSCFINPFLRFFGMVSSFIVIFSLVTGNDKSSGAESFRSSAEFRFDILDFALWVFLFMLIFSGLSLDRC